MDRTLTFEDTVQKNKQETLQEPEHDISKKDTLKKTSLEEIDEERKMPFINVSLLPLKLHYFASYGAFGGVLPFLPVLMKSLGITATAVGVIYTILPFFVLFTKPIIGAVTDYFKNTRCMIISLILLATAFHCLLLLIPPVQPITNGFKCGDNRAAITLPIVFNTSCIDQQHTHILMCKMKVNICSQNETNIELDKDISEDICTSENKKLRLNFTLKISQNSVVSPVLEIAPGLSIQMLNVYKNASFTSICNRLINNSISITCVPNTDGCISSLNESVASHEYSSYQFWTVLLLVILGGMFSTGMFTISDAVCFEILGDRPGDYGKQRLWSVFSWGLIALLTGYLNDLRSRGSGNPDYSSGFFLMITMTILDIVLHLSLLNFKGSPSSHNIFKDIGRLFTSYEVILFSTGVFIIGTISSLLYTYEFWFLQNLGASQMLLGLSITSQCLISEIPFFFFSGCIINKLGHSLCLTLTFAAFALRYYFYSVLINPWYVLLIDLLHGWTYGVFYATLASFAKRNAPQGTEATMQGVLGGLYEGLGLGVGNLIGGVGFDKFGGHNTYLYGAIFSSICMLIFLLLRHLLRF